MNHLLVIVTSFVFSSVKASEECGVFLASSTISGAGWGLFAGRDFNANELVLPGDVVIPLHDLSWHNGVDSYNPRSPSHLWENYVWDSSSFPGMDREGKDVAAAAFSVGALPNCHYPLTNIDREASPSLLDRSNIQRHDPGAGAFTPYHGHKGTAYVNISAGMELFVDYGEKYFDRWREDKKKPIVPRSKDYKTGKELLYRLLRVSGVNECIADKKCLATPSPLMETADLLLQTIHDINTEWRTGAIATLPYNASQMPILMEKGVEFRDFRQSHRSLEELSSLGMCMDNVQEGQSTIPHAGRGAFTRRFIPEGEVVVPVPLIHIPNRSIYFMYESSYRGKNLAPNVHKGPIHQQLLVNYCFGHNHSSLLLCPYGSGAGLINHNRTRANVKIRWSHRATQQTAKAWWDQPLEEWAFTQPAALGFELVATRDLQANEEVFMSYGTEWENAWLSHIKKWQPPHEAMWYRPAYELNDDSNLVVRTRSEGSYVVDRRFTANGGYRYTVELFEPREMAIPSASCKSRFIQILWDAPRDAFHFEDPLYSQDHLQSWSFRHDIRVPDELFPEAWRNLG